MSLEVNEKPLIPMPFRVLCAESNFRSIASEAKTTSYVTSYNSMLLYDVTGTMHFIILSELIDTQVSYGKLCILE